MGADDAILAMQEAIDRAVDSGCKCEYPDAAVILCIDGHVHGVTVLHEDLCPLQEIERKIDNARWN